MPQRLEEYYRRIEGLMAEGEALIAARDPATVPLLKRRIAESTLVIASYQMFVHREVFVPLLDDGDAALRVRVSEIKVECIALTEDLRANVRDFLIDESPLDWSAVGAKVAWFNARVRKHIADVRELIASDLSPADQRALIARRAGTVGVQTAA